MRSGLPVDVRDSDTVETRSHARRGSSVVARWVLALMAVALLAAAAVFALSPALRARLLRRAVHNVPLQIHSTPAGAEAFVDDVRVGTTPVGASVPPGQHRVRLVLRGYQPWHEEVDPVATPEVGPTLERVRLAALVVESDPDRADVFLDEERRGTTPLELNDVEAGAHTLRIAKGPTYQPVVQHIELNAAETRRVVVRLESGIEDLYEARIRKEPGKLSNYTELLHDHVLNKEPHKIAATVARAVGALKAAEPQATELAQFFEELRKVFRWQAGPLDTASRDKLLGTLASLLEQLVMAAPADYTRYGHLVTMLSQGGRFDEVYKVCEKTAQLPAGRGTVHYYVATVCLAQGEATNAIRLLERAVELQPSFYSARLSLGSVYVRAERFDDALRQYTEAEKHIPASTPYYAGLLHVEMARLLVAKKNIEGAIARYKRAIGVAAPPAYTCQWRIQFAELLLEQGRKKDAIEQYQEVAKLTTAETALGIVARRALLRLAEK